MIGRISIALFLFLTLQQYWIQVSARSFDYYYFVQQWPGSYCDTSKGCCYGGPSGIPPKYFGIHGLWPQYRNGRWPQNCDKSNTFRISKVSGLISSLNKYWGSLNCPNNNVKFWKHEWEKHGTCSTLDERTYFEKGIALREKVDLLANLTSAGIVPNGNAYSIKDIKNAIKKGLGYEVVLNCNRGMQGERQLLEIYVCVSKKDASTLIDCPPSMLGASCPFEVVFPPTVDYLNEKLAMEM